MSTKSGINRSVLPAAAVATALFFVAVATTITLSRSNNRNSSDNNDETSVDETKQNKVSRSILEEEKKEESPSPVISTREVPRRRVLQPHSITITYASTTGTCKQLAHTLGSKMEAILNSGSFKYTVQINHVDSFDWWDELLTTEENNNSSGKPSKSSTPIVFFLLPTWMNGTLPPTDGVDLVSQLEEISTDWRVEPHPLRNKIRYGVFGMGSSEYDPDTFCKPAKRVWELMNKLGASKVKMGLGDEAKDGAMDKFDYWMEACLGRLKITSQAVNNISSAKTIKQKEPQTNNCCDDDDHDHDKHESKHDSEDDEDEDEDDEEPEVADMEDLAAEEEKGGEPKEMVTPKQAKALKKEGYKLIGTHSAVKLCRWTKHQLRGRGGCYKHTFYGITSYQCMEATPSLACANKCVFCWRHHKNPVGKTWRWKTDDPTYIVKTAIETHVHMIKETKGIPGILPERWREAHTVKHCALSLVGEPIMYPEINQLLNELHKRDISTFLVTNGQHPEAIKTLVPITQLYVSVDAPTPTSLVEIDRPLFSDAWERLCQSLTFLKDKGQRTVARLTVVKGWNSDEIQGYADLIALGHVSLVEVKGVTFCGKSDASNLNMSNSPWHHEVVSITQKLLEKLNKLSEKGGVGGPPMYGLACEHRHSCSVLLARKDQFYNESKQKWNTWIEYDKFQQLVVKQTEDPAFTYEVKDYVAEAPTWAQFGAHEEGFDPTDTRVYKKKKMYTHFDERGIPTHDSEEVEIAPEEMERLWQIMEEKKKDVGLDNIVEEKKGGEKDVVNVSLMFRGMTLAK